MSEILAEMRKAADLLMSCSDLTFYPIGICFAHGEDEVPEGVIFPNRDCKEKWERYEKSLQNICAAERIIV